MSNETQILKVVCFANFFVLTLSALTFYNIECDSVDETVVVFEYCYIKAINRSLKYMSLKANILKLPITNLLVQVTVSYRASGWKPFLFNYTINACKFLKSKNGLPFVEHVYKTIENFSNLNHTCPFNHDIIFSNLSTTFADDLWTKMLPTPEGQYRFNSIWSTNNITIAEFKLFVRIS